MMNIEETAPATTAGGSDTKVVPETAPTTTAAAAAGGSDTEAIPFIKDDDEDDDDRQWTKPSDVNPKFPFCYQLREPYQWFNRVVFVTFFALFLFFSYQIISDYMAQKTNPPTSNNYRYGSDQDFPGMAFCMHKTAKASQPGLEPLFALYQDGGNHNNGDDITSSLKPIDCDGNISSVGNDGNGHLCWYMDDDFPAFNTSKAYEEVSCAHRNSISIGFYFNISEYDPNVMNIGIDGYLFPTTNSNRFIDRVCEMQKNPLLRDCSNCMIKIDSRKEADTCEQDLNVDAFYVTNKLSNIISLERSEGTHGPQCAKEDGRIHWNPITVVSNHNIEFKIPSNDNNITLADGDITLQSTVLMEFSFRSGDKIVNSYNLLSFGSMFGSLGGWWGFLADGWGLLTVLFMVEEFINWVVATNFK